MSLPNIGAFTWIKILFLVRIWFSQGSSSPIYSGTGCKSIFLTATFVLWLLLIQSLICSHIFGEQIERSPTFHDSGTTLDGFYLDTHESNRTGPQMKWTPNHESYWGLRVPGYLDTAISRLSVLKVSLMSVIQPPLRSWQAICSTLPKKCFSSVFHWQILKIEE